MKTGTEGTTENGLGAAYRSCYAKAATGSPVIVTDYFARMNRIDQAIFESEQEIANGAEAVDAEIVFAELEKKHFG